jgi:hypothetical protein
MLPPASNTPKWKKLGHALQPEERQEGFSTRSSDAVSSRICSQAVLQPRGEISDGCAPSRPEKWCAKGFPSISISK